MSRVLKLTCLLLVTFLCGPVLGKTPNFGERIKKENESLIDVVFGPRAQHNKNIAGANQLLNTTHSKSDFQSNQNVKNHIKSKEKSKILEAMRRGADAQHEIERGFESEASKPESLKFEMSLADIPELAATEDVEGVPIAPPPPKPPQYPGSDFERFQPRGGRGEQHFEDLTDKQSFYGPAPEHTLEADFSMNIPKGFPHPNNDAQADYKKEQMGAQNYRGKPWGTKVSYTYRDPKNPKNFMEMSQVSMTINRQMDPQEAQSQIQSFLEAAQSGQYGPLSQTGEMDQQATSHFAPPEPLEPSEHKFDMLK